MRSGVKKSATIFIRFGGIVSIPAALFASRQLIRFSIYGGATSIKKNFSFHKKFCSLNFFSICFMLGWVLQAFKILQSTSCLLLLCNIFETFFFWGGGGGRRGLVSTTYLHNIDIVFIKCANKCFASVVTTSFSTRVISLLPRKK